MKFGTSQRFTNLILMLVALGIVSLILWNTNSFFEKFKEEERIKVENWAAAELELAQSDLEQDLSPLTLQVLQSNRSTPMILMLADGTLKPHNLPERIAQDSLKLIDLIDQFRSENEAIEIAQDGEVLQTIYYGNSEVLNKLKYYPIALLLIIFLFAAVIFFFFRTNKISDQNKLWAGMAKETAHQIGTPLTSLLGWNELLKTEDINQNITHEIGKDIERLQTITDRFSKIGSLPTLKPYGIVQATSDAISYLNKRSSKLVVFDFHSEIREAMVHLNLPLFNWSIENLVKNGIDAMKGEGELTVVLKERSGWILILIKDTGHGIPKADFQRIFNPGVTSKKRGWGLGLSLVKRIIEEYHQGKIKVLNSSKEGTVMQISLRKSV